MSSSTSVTAINNLLSPYLFQVIGSTPKSIRDSIKTAGLKDKRDVGLQLAATCVFASAVNKATLESFLQKPELILVRPTVLSSFSVSGKTNMTGLTLLGHCLLTTNLVDGITFASEFRKKMGQNSIWLGELKSGSLSDKQKEILLEKKRITDSIEASLLGSGFFKYVGIDTRPWTADELAFWEESVTQETVSAPQPMQFSSAVTPPRSKGKSPAAPPVAPAPEPADFYVYTFSDGSEHTLSETAVKFYLSKHNDNNAQFEDSVKSRGDKVFSATYYTAATRGLQAAATVAGGTVAS